jgi:taurine dioxygenase
MIDIIPTGKILGATVKGLDLSQGLADSAFDQILRALGRYGVLRFPQQALKPAAQKAFASRFGSLEVHVSGMHQDADHPEVMFLSNIVENGKPIGLADAGQGWHTDMSYSRVIALANVLHAIKVPRDQSGHPLGSTQFAAMHAAYDDLPAEMKERLKNATAVHDFNKFWEMMRRDKGSKRPPLSPQQRASKPPVSHPIFLTHPITGRKVLYADPGYTVRINNMDAAESDEILSFLFAHQLQPRYCYEHHWSAVQPVA